MNELPSLNFEAKLEQTTTAHSSMGLLISSIFSIYLMKVSTGVFGYCRCLRLSLSEEPQENKEQLSRDAFDVDHFSVSEIALNGSPTKTETGCTHAILLERISRKTFYTRRFDDVIIATFWRRNKSAREPEEQPAHPPTVACVIPSLKMEELRAVPRRPPTPPTCGVVADKDLTRFYLSILRLVFVAPPAHWWVTNDVAEITRGK